MPPAPKTIRQQLVDKLKLRLAAITIAHGYQTDLGTRPIEEWPTQKQFEELPALGVFDLVNATVQSQPDERRVLNTMPAQVRIFLKREVTPAQARIYIADVMKAIITDPDTNERDPTFGGLAWDTKPVEDGFVVPNDTFEIDGASVGFNIEFLSEPFNAYQ